jgi:tripartite-type tricarboxylate transporter receptor subunit TctC
MLTRRDFIAASGAAAVTATSARSAAAFPEKNITFIIPYGPGGGFDTFARVVAPVMERYLPRRVHVVPMNIATAGGGKAMAQLYRTRPDGYTMALFPIPGAFILQEQQNARAFDLNKFTWLGSLGPSDNYVLAVGANSPIRSVPELQALSKTREVKFTTTGPDGTSYLATVISTKLLGIRTRLITGYAGSNDYVVGAIRGDGDAAVVAISTARPFHDSKQMRIIASFEPKSSVPGVPDATALGKPELGQVTIDRMVAAPPGLPANIRGILTSALDRAVRDPQVVSWAKGQGIPWTPHPPGHADALFRTQAAFFQKWKTYLPTG